jgi:hypothetical protein
MPKAVWIHTARELGRDSGKRRFASVGHSRPAFEALYYTVQEIAGNSPESVDFVGSAA